MTLVVGLGNPGGKYDKTRHNAGFMLIDKILDSSFIKQSLKCDGELYKKGNILLLKPHTFMNNSGISVAKVVNFYDVDRIIVCHDELEIGFCALKCKKGGSSGGHNGLKSIDSHIGNDYERIRLGIGRGEYGVVDFVLGNFSDDELKQFDEFLDYASEALRYLINNDINSTKQKYNKK